MRAKDFISEAKTGYDKEGRLITVDGPLKIIKNPSGDTTWWINGQPVGFYESSERGPGRWIWYTMLDDALDSDERALGKKLPNATFRKVNVVSKEVFDKMLQIAISEA